jgi:hypothetical protein
VLARSGDHFAIDPVPAPGGTVVLTADTLARSRGGNWTTDHGDYEGPVATVLAPWLLAELPAGRPRFALHATSCPVPDDSRPGPLGNEARNRRPLNAWQTLRQREESRERERRREAEKRARQRPPINLADAWAALAVWEKRGMVDRTSALGMRERKMLAEQYGWTSAQLAEAIVLAEQARARGEVA